VCLWIDESQIRVILLDIEGTATPIKFVYQNAFSLCQPASWNRFFENTIQDPEIRSLIPGPARAGHDLEERNGT